MRGDFNVSDLGPEAQQLIQAGRSALRPTVADRERVAAALRERGGMFVEPALATTARFGWGQVSATVVGLGAVGLIVAAGVWERASEPPAAAPPVVSVSAALAAAPAEGVGSPHAAESPRAAERPYAAEPKSTRTAAKPPADRLAEEVEILSRAQTEMHAGRFGAALTLLDQHARAFPRGSLAPERRASRVQALCALGHSAEADKELARLAPGSLHEARAREACTLRASSKVP
jgi:hypothetical protein